MTEENKIEDSIAQASQVERLVMSRMRYAIEQRLRFLDFLFEHYGMANRKHLEDYFGISTPQATKDFGDYMKIAPDNIRYSTTEKVYKRNPEFVRVWT